MELRWRTDRGALMAAIAGWSNGGNVSCALVTLGERRCSALRADGSLSDSYAFEPSPLTSFGNRRLPAQMLRILASTDLRFRKTQQSKRYAALGLAERERQLTETYAAEFRELDEASGTSSEAVRRRNSS